MVSFLFGVGHDHQVLQRNQFQCRAHALLGETSKPDAYFRKNEKTASSANPNAMSNPAYSFLVTDL